MKRLTRSRFLLLTLSSIVVVAGGTGLVVIPICGADVGPGTANISAKAYSSGVTAGTFVKLQAAGVITPATAAGDAVVGVCDTTAAAGQLTSYAPVGAQIYVTSGEAIAVGDLLTAGTAGKAFVLDADDSVTQRIGAVALSAAGGADVAVRAIVVAAVVETKLATTGNVTITGNLTLPTTNALKLRDADTSISSSGAGTMDIAATTLVKSSAHIRLATDKQLQFRDGNCFIASNTADNLDINAVGIVALDGGSLSLYTTGGLLFDCGSVDVSTDDLGFTVTNPITSSGPIAIQSTSALRLRDANSTINSPATGTLALYSSSRITAESPILGVNETLTAITGNVTLDANSSGVVFNVTADATVTLPATAAGITYTFICDGADASVQITLSPNASDLIRGKGYIGADNTDWINTKTTAHKGDFITIVGDGAAGWFIQRQGGTWTHQ
jgi:hypothetical protein